MPKRRLSLGELELEVLKVIWERQPCPVQQVAQIVCERRGSAPTTVLTVMQRLHKKGFLRRRKCDGIYHYTTVQNRSQVLSGLVRQFVDRVLDGSALPFVAYLANAKGLAPQQADALREIVEEMESPGEEGQ